jgi:prepilin-type N-terminal cleavage/methylation domain-containing protein
MVLREILSKSKVSRGFTLVELLVSISIMAIILGITFSGGPQATTRLSLSDNNSQIELMIREAQLQGSAVNSVNGTFGGVGIFFDRATSSQVLKFRDIVDPTIQKAIGVGNGLYDASLSSGVPPIFEKDSIFLMTNRNRIQKLCVATSTSPVMCNDTYTPHVNTLTVSFNRPKQTAHIYVNGTTSIDYTFACIQIYPVGASTTDFVRSVAVYGSGMVTKAASPCN